MEVVLISGDEALRIEIDDMRLMRHPSKGDEVEHKHGMVRAIIKYSHPSPSPELVKEALKELDALKREAPVKQYERRVAEAVSG